MLVVKRTNMKVNGLGGNISHKFYTQMTKYTDSCDLQHY